MLSHLPVAILAASLAAVPPVEPVDAEGEAAVVNGDEGAALEQAKQAALREAVSKVAGTLISSDTLSDGAVLVHDRIYAHSAGYVHKWNVTEQKVEDGAAHVKVHAEVGTAELDRDLEAVKMLLEGRNKPRTVLLISEQAVGTTEPFMWWQRGGKAGGGMVSVSLGTFENGFIDALQKYGWNFVDHQVLDGKLKVNRPVVSELTNQDAIEFGKLASADLAIVGTAVAQSPGQSELAPGMFAAHANISLRAVNCDDGRILGTVDMTVGDITTLDASAENAGIKALRMASKKAALQMQAEVLEHWKQDANGTASITMKVTGLPNRRALKSFETLLANVRGVSGVHEQSYDGSEAALSVDASGNTQMLADQVDGKSVKGGLEVNVRHVSGNELDVQLAR